MPTPHTHPPPRCAQGKEDCARKAAYRGMDIAADLMRTCPALSLPQVWALGRHTPARTLGLAP